MTRAPGKGLDERERGRPLVGIAFVWAVRRIASGLVSFLNLFRQITGVSVIRLVSCNKILIED